MRSSALYTSRASISRDRGNIREQIIDFASSSCDEKGGLGSYEFVIYTNEVDLSNNVAFMRHLI